MPSSFTAALLPDYSNGIGNSLMARQHYARYLFIMMYLLTDLEFNGYNDATLTQAQVIELNLRRIAQWAINVVDYRDSDSIMTPFEYDIQPFDANGWEVDGVVGSSDDTTVPDRRLVWGCEQPALLLTETLALHDRRVKDTNVDKLTTDMMEPDEDVDQVRVPEGSLFLELYCPENGNNSVHVARSPDLHILDGTSNTWKLNLAQLAPSDGARQYPVWRIAISRSALNLGANTNDINQRVAANPDSINFDPVPLSGTLPGTIQGSVFDTGSEGGAVTPERIVWFTDAVPNVSAAEIAISFYNVGKVLDPTAVEPWVAPGQYAVVGPRPTTYVGRSTVGNNPSTQAFVLNTTGTGSFSYTRANGNSPVVSPSQQDIVAPAVPIICAFQDIPPGWPQPIGLNVSEPLYQTGFPNTYYNPTPNQPGPSGINDTFAAPLDVPLDGSSASGGVANAPLKIDGIFATQTRPNYKTAFLQRLANPLQPFDVAANPYITVDWQPIDLVVFNGEARQDPTNEEDPDDPLFLAPPAELLAGGRERGDITATNPAGLWRNYVQNPTPANSIKGVATNVFDYNIHQSIGYLNRTMGLQRWAANITTAPPTTVPVNYGYQNAPDPTMTAKPFSWITWNNRPYTSGMELLLVPPTSAEQLMRDFTTAPGALFDPYAPGKTPFSLPFKHLSNFFHTGDGTVNSLTPQSPYFYRLLDYVGVPSPFVGTDTVFRPADFNGAMTSPYGLDEQQMASHFRPPFSHASNYREPGRVNINTIAGQHDGTGLVASQMWTAILNGAATPTWPEIVGSRRGEAAITNNVTTPQGTISSVFANPFRSAAGAAFRLPGTVTATPNLPPEVNVTMLRPNPDPAKATSPLFASLLDPTRPYVDPDQHPYFRYQNLLRLNNSLTTRSNVYAVWITLGYFEVSPWDAPPQDGIPDIDVAHPDGWQLGAELGSDTGDIQRHRAFYIFDRSIPVGYEPGRDHNLDDATLVKRFIE
ncbi:MAG: hypothetical protein WD845_16790 [Pirellulales bacterium]